MEKSRANIYIIGELFGYPIFAFVLQKFSRKICFCITFASFVITCVLLLSPASYWLLLVARVFTAISEVATQMICLIYVSEIAPDDMRGALISTRMLLRNIAQSVSFAIFTAEATTFLPWITIIATLFCGCAYFWLPESPIYLLRRRDPDAAARSLKWLFGNSADVSQEIEKRNQILKATRSHPESTTSIFQYCINRRTLIYGGTVVLLYLTGGFTVYTTKQFNIFPILDTFMNKTGKYSFWFFFSFLSIVANLIAIFTSDRQGRKILILISAFGCSVVLLVYGTVHYIMVEKYNNALGNVNIFTAIFYLMFLFSINLGIGILCDVVITDIFPPKILNTQIAMLNVLDVLMYIAEIYLFPSITSLVNVSGTMWVFGVLFMVSTLFIITFLPETKNRYAGYLLRDREETIVFSTLQEEDDLLSGVYTVEDENRYLRRDDESM